MHLLLPNSTFKHTYRELCYAHFWLCFWGRSHYVAWLTWHPQRSSIQGKQISRTAAATRVLKSCTPDLRYRYCWKGHSKLTEWYRNYCDSMLVGCAGFCPLELLLKLFMGEGPLSVLIHNSLRTLGATGCSASQDLNSGRSHQSQKAASPPVFPALSDALSDGKGNIQEIQNYFYWVDRKS